MAFAAHLFALRNGGFAKRKGNLADFIPVRSRQSMCNNPFTSNTVADSSDSRALPSGKLYILCFGVGLYFATKFCRMVPWCAESTELGG